ncbi:MAG TPA: ABC transporter ATP-binding protein, partial [Polyangia bacterium]
QAASEPGRSTQMAILEGRNLRKTYRLSRKNTVEALKGVEIMIEAGEMVAIMGPSGSGKSTLMHILGLLHAPDLNHGPRPELTFGGRDMVRLGDRERTRIRGREMGFVFQDFNLVPTLTALENVMLACEYSGRGGGSAAALEALALVGLADRAGHRPAELSGGEQQRVAIARALVNDPLVLLADEPTGNLDPDLAQEIMTLFERINGQGTTVIVATHDRSLIQRMKKRVIGLDHGRIAFDQPAPTSLVTV